RRRGAAEAYSGHERNIITFTDHSFASVEAFARPRRLQGAGNYVQKTLSGGPMSTRIALAAAMVAVAGIVTGPSFAQTPPSPPPFATTKVEGTDNVYIFRNGNHQAMFVVTKAGVIATDPVAYGRPTGGQTYVDEIKKVTKQPIKYLIYSHHHYDHI